MQEIIDLPGCVVMYGMHPVMIQIIIRFLIRKLNSFLINNIAVFLLCL